MQLETSKMATVRVVQSARVFMNVSSIIFKFHGEKLCTCPGRAGLRPCWSPCWFPSDPLQLSARSVPVETCGDLHGGRPDGGPERDGCHAMSPWDFKSWKLGEGVEVEAAKLSEKKRQAPFWGLFLGRGLKTEYLDFMRKQNAMIVWSWDMLTSSCPCFLPAVDLPGFASPGCFLLEQLFSRPFSKERGHRGPDVCKCLGAGVKLGELPNHRVHQFFKSHIIA